MAQSSFGQVKRCSTLTGSWLIVAVNTGKQQTYHFKQPIAFNGCSYSAKLEVNWCGGMFKQLYENKVEFTSADCTEACCDQESSEALLYSLTRMEYFTLKGDTLFLTGNVKEKLRIDRLGKFFQGETTLTLVRQPTRK